MKISAKEKDLSDTIVKMMHDGILGVWMPAITFKEYAKYRIDSESADKIIDLKEKQIIILTEQNNNYQKTIDETSFRVNSMQDKLSKLNKELLKLNVYKYALVGVSITLVIVVCIVPAILLYNYMKFTFN